MRIVLLLNFIWSKKKRSFSLLFASAFQLFIFDSCWHRDAGKDGERERERERRWRNIRIETKRMKSKGAKGEKIKQLKQWVDFYQINHWLTARAVKFNFSLASSEIVYTLELMTFPVLVYSSLRAAHFFQLQLLVGCKKFRLKVTRGRGKRRRKYFT